MKTFTIYQLLLDILENRDKEHITHFNVHSFP